MSEKRCSCCRRARNGSLPEVGCEQCNGTGYVGRARITALDQFRSAQDQRTRAIRREAFKEAAKLAASYPHECYALAQAILALSEEGQ